VNPSKIPDVSASNMWDNFNMVEYLAELNDEHDRNLENINKTIKKHSKPKDFDELSWKPSITVPQPFNMTVREHQKPHKKSRSQQVFEEEEIARVEKEAQETSKQFRANPVPGHTYLPLYKEMQAKDRAFRNHNREVRKTELKSMEKPFKFVEREKDRDKLSQIEKIMDEVEYERPKTQKFKAKPVPDHVYDSTSIMDRFREEELYRQVRRKVRSDELLRKSKLPMTMQEPKNKFRMSKMKEAVSDSKTDFIKTKNPGATHQPKINHTIPDFDSQYKKFQQTVAKSRTQAEATVCKPFKLRTEKISKVADHTMCPKETEKQRFSKSSQNPNLSQVP
jgi:protein FAM161A